MFYRKETEKSLSGFSLYLMHFLKYFSLLRGVFVYNIYVTHIGHTDHSEINFGRDRAI